jgi:hypothetical protein
MVGSVRSRGDARHYPREGSWYDFMQGASIRPPYSIAGMIGLWFTWKAFKWTIRDRKGYLSTFEYEDLFIRHYCVWL